ncbi:MAG: NUDIX domain-containing protein [Phycisphaeraceae bacterium]
MSKPFTISPKAVIRDSSGRALVIRRSAASRFWPDKWDLVGGKMDAGETFDQTLLREAKEETGLTIELTRLLGASEYELPHIKLVFVVMEATMISGTLRLSEEHCESRWVCDGELATLDMVPPLAQALRSPSTEG